MSLPQQKKCRKKIIFPNASIKHCHINLIYINLYVKVYNIFTLKIDIQSSYITRVVSKLHSIMENGDCRKYSKNLFKKLESTYKSLYYIVFLEICKSFEQLTKSSVSKKKICIGHPSKEFTEECRSSVKDMDAAIYFYGNTVRNFFI